MTGLSELRGLWDYVDGQEKLQGCVGVHDRVVGVSESYASTADAQKCCRALRAYLDGWLFSGLSRLVAIRVAVLRTNRLVAIPGKSCRAVRASTMESWVSFWMLAPRQVARQEGAG